MAESIAQPDKFVPKESMVFVGATPYDNEQKTTTTSAVSQSVMSSAIIWTPRFILLFFLTLVIGLSVESLLTQGWLNGFYRTEWVLLAHVALLLTLLVALVIRARSFWMRLGGIFGCIWATFTSASLVASLLSVDAKSAIAVQLHAAMSSALLGAYICFSTNRILLRRWDNWFFRLVPFVGGCFIAILYLRSAGSPHHLRVLTSATSTVVLYICILIWWLRPSCWKSQPCPTFLFGVAPIFMLILPLISATSPDTYFFFSQVTLLCILLGIMRVQQGEMR